MSEPDLSEFEKLSQRAARRPCKLGAKLDALGTEDRRALDAALATDKGRITNTAIAEWLGGRGIEITYQVVAIHRQGRCSCG